LDLKKHIAQHVGMVVSQGTPTQTLPFLLAMVRPLTCLLSTSQIINKLQSSYLNFFRTLCCNLICLVSTIWEEMVDMVPPDILLIQAH